MPASSSDDPSDAPPLHNNLPSPHIVWIVADDLGTFDVPFTNSGSEVRTPTLSRLAAAGLVLDQYYVQPLCTPSRAAFMTGRHPVQLGLQHGVIRDADPDAVPANETMLPELLHDAGYHTFFLGKWHLGFSQPQYTPERRGFDTAFGYYTGNAEYFNHTSPCWACGNYTAVDLHFANSSHFIGVLGASDVYSTELFADAAVATLRGHVARHVTPAGVAAAPPLFLYVAFEAAHGASSCYVADGPPDCSHPDDDELQVPPQYEAAQAHIEAAPRRAYAGMVSALDEGVARVSGALVDLGLMPRTLLLFTTDNGAPYKHLGGAAMSNWPLRGGKAELWEGGVRGACFLAGGALPPAAAGQRTDALITAADWLPTLLDMARVPLPLALAGHLYGVSAVRVLQAPRTVGRYDVRSELLHNSDPVTHRAALRSGDLKVLRNEPPSAWGPDPRGGANATANAAQSGPDWGSWSKGSGGHDSPRYHLFDVVADPQERYDLSKEAHYASDVARLIARLEDAEGRLSVPLRAFAPDPAARPVPLPGHHVCSPSPVGPILCDEPIGVWQPWRPDELPAGSFGTSASELFWLAVRAGASVLIGAVLVAAIRRGSLRRLRQRLASVLVPNKEIAPGEGAPAGSGSHEHARALLPAVDMCARGLACLIAVGAFGVALHQLVTLAVASAAAASARHPVWPADVSVVMMFEHPAALWEAHYPPSMPPSMPPSPSAPPPPEVQRNNILLILTDDQDQTLGAGFIPGASADAPTPMPHTRRLLAREGSTAANYFSHSPICCPSRAQLLTGRYLHNLAVNRADPPADARENCMHVDGRRVNNRSFAVALQAAGYTTGLFGKYLNKWPMSYVPRGFDAFLGNGGGHYLGASFVSLGMGFHGIADGKLDTPAGAYSTAVIGNATEAWVRRVLDHAVDGRPFFAMMAPKAPHEPFMPPPWYADTWHTDWPAHEPRPEAWNATAATRGAKHGNLRTQHSLTDAAARVVSGVFRNRWRTLLAVDDAIAAVIAACSPALERTFVIFTSDHGFSLGEYGLLMDKRHVYDFDTRVPLLVRGPGIAPGSVMSAPATHVDLAPTILAMAGIAEVDTTLAAMDGRSLLPLLVADHGDPRLGRYTRAQLAAAGSTEEVAATWRRAVLIEHLFWTTNVKCVANCSFASDSLVTGAFPRSDVWCADVRALTDCWATPGTDPAWTGEYDPRCDHECYPTEDEYNNFAALRHVGPGPLGPSGSLYAEFHVGDASKADIDWSRRPASVEMYDGADTWQMANLLGAHGVTHDTSADRARLTFAAERLALMLRSWSKCEGSACP